MQMAALGRIILVGAVLAALVSTVGCTQPRTQASPSPAAQVISDVAYAPAQPEGGIGHLLDLYLPAGRDKPVPLIIWSGGTGWMTDYGNSTTSGVARMFNPHGYAVAGVNIRSSSQATFPAQLSDMKAAIRFLRANAKRFHLDAERFGVAGDSSGGWAAVMAAVTGDEPDLEGDVGVHGPSSRVQAAAAFYTPTDFLQIDEHLPGCLPSDNPTSWGPCASSPRSALSLLLGCPIQSCPDAVAAANPIGYVGTDDPPLLLLHGQRDTAVPWQQSLVLFQAVQQASGRAQLVLLPHGEHGQANEFLTDPSVNAGAQLLSTAEGRQQPRDVHLTPDFFIGFFDRYLR
jgi:acetyl esterase/lipase